VGVGVCVAEHGDDVVGQRDAHLAWVVGGGGGWWW
jgi:hypothetical protein